MTREPCTGALLSLPVEATPGERQAAFWRMSRAERLACYRRGELTFGECLQWGARRPDEPPLIGGEFEYIAVATPEWADATE